MNFQRSTKVDRLTAEDRELFGRIAYAMVVQISSGPAVK